MLHMIVRLDLGVLVLVCARKYQEVDLTQTTRQDKGMKHRRVRNPKIERSMVLGDEDDALSVFVIVEEL